MAMTSELGSYEPLNESSPIVSMECAIGEQYEYADFDYSAFAKEATGLGITPEDQGKLTVEIRAKHGLGIGRGTYNKAKKRLTALATPSINKHFMHELKHAADDTVGELHHDRRFWIGKAGMASAILPPLANIGAVAEYIAGNSLAGDILNGTGLLGAAACAGAVIYGYVRHPDEIRADEVAENSFVQVVKLKAAPEHPQPQYDTVQELDMVFKRFCRSF